MVAMWKALARVAVFVEVVKDIMHLLHTKTNIFD